MILFGVALIKIHILGVISPKNTPKNPRDQEIPAKTVSRNKSKTVEDTTKVTIERL